MTYYDHVSTSAYKKSTPTDFKESFIQFKKNVRTKYLFRNEREERIYNPKIYIKSPEFIPPLANANIEDKMEKLERSMNKRLQNKHTVKKSNLTRTT